MTSRVLYLLWLNLVFIRWAEQAHFQGKARE